MNPKPLVALNHFTVPTAIFGTPLAPRTLERESNDGYQHSTQPAWRRLVQGDDTPFLTAPVTRFAATVLPVPRNSHVTAVQARHRGTAQKPQGAVQVLPEKLEDSLDALLASSGEPVGPRAADHHRPGAEREGLGDVRAAPE